jgi:hypothetical protein
VRATQAAFTAKQGSTHARTGSSMATVETDDVSNFSGMM